MPTARTKANRKYNEKAYDKVQIQVHKGLKDVWKQAAERLGLSLAGLIVKAVEEYIQNHYNDYENLFK